MIRGPVSQVLACVYSPQFDGKEPSIFFEHVSEALVAQARLEADGADVDVVRASEFPYQAAVARCIFNPFVIAIPAWQSPTALALAQAAYEERVMPNCELELQRLCILADAIEDAGCSDTELLAHLRGPGPHYRGCWAVDAVLGRA